MSRRNRVSIVLANWNSAQFLGLAIESVLRQTVDDWHLVIVDTGSTDESRAILERYAAMDDRIELILIPERLDCPAALNIGLASADGEFIARIESDDMWMPHRLETQLAFLNHSSQSQVGICGSDAVLIDALGRVRGTKLFPRGPEQCLKAIWYRCPLCHSAVLARRHVFFESGGYKSAFHPAEDLELWFRIIQKWKISNVPESLISYRIWPGGLTSKQLRRLVWQSHRVRSNAVKNLGLSRSWPAAIYSFASLGASYLPPKIARGAFQAFLTCSYRVSDTLYHKAHRAQAVGKNVKSS